MDGSQNNDSRRTLVVYLLLLVAIIAGIAVVLASRPAPVLITVNPPLPTATPLPSVTPGPISVYVTGAVAQAGTIIMLPAGSRVQDAITSAGGALPEADLERVNLAAIMRDGDQIHVPVRDEASLVMATPSGGERIRINSATLEEIDELPGIGPALAQRIIDYRDAFGLFGSLDDLDEVEGIGPELLQEIAPLVSFD
jgi:competence protein ComEA